MRRSLSIESTGLAGEVGVEGADCVAAGGGRAALGGAG